MAKHYFNLSKVLKRLLYDKRMNASELAKEVNLPAPTVHRLLTGKSTRPYKSSLEPIADFFSITIEQLLGENPLPNQQNFSDLPAKSRKIIEVPIIDWKELKNLNKNNTAHETIAAMNDLSPHCFATRLPDSSMEPTFPKGSILILDPDKEAADRSFILVRLQNSDIFIFRQILIDGENKFLKPLNPDLNTFKMRLLDEHDKIIAILVEARQVYTPDQ